MVIETLCVHWWMIGEYSIGQCKKCGATRDFAKLRDEEQTRKTFHKGKTKSTVSRDFPEFRADYNEPGIQDNF
jgi:hypothetical protein